LFKGYLLTNVVLGLVHTIYMYVLWPIVPWFICDAMFMFWCYLFPIFLILSMLYFIWDVYKAI